MKYLILLSFLFASCATNSPDEWPEKDHKRMMLSCRIACGKPGMESYDSTKGSCQCKVKTYKIDE